MTVRATASAFILAALLAAPAVAQEHQVFLAYAPKPGKPAGWVAPNRPVWRLSEILAAHKGQANWTQAIVRDHDYSADYIQMAPGEKTRTMFYGDDRAFWVVWGGQIRFTIQGQQPFIATRGFLVQVPFRTPFSMETVGGEPSLRFEVRRTGAEPYYPVIDGEPAPSAPGIAYQKTSYSLLPDPYTAVNRPYIDFLKDYVNNPANPKGNHTFVADDHNWGNIIRGMGSPLPPDTNKGHFHTNLGEFWFIPEGKIDFLLEGKPLLTAGEGDIVYAPAGRWHRASNNPGQMDTRIAITVRPKNMHNFAPDAGAAQ
jgi:mannose-6-phosphate isomerase-like protein (cupin superfamily)